MESNIVELFDLKFSWGERATQSNVNPFELSIDHFGIQKHEKIFLHGPSGSGKSTLVGLICGTIRPISGEVYLNEKNLTDLSGSQVDRHRADNIGIIYQMFNLLPYLSALENVLLPLEFSKTRKQKVGASKEECRNEASRLFANLGLDAINDGNAKPGELSVGQQQRVAAARALIGAPRLIIADEPTSALDFENQKNFLDLLFSEVENSNSSLLMISHNPSLAKHFDRSIALSNGEFGKGA